MNIFSAFVNYMMQDHLPHQQSWHSFLKVCTWDWNFLFTHCSNLEFRICKKLHKKSKAATRTPLQRVSKRAPTWYSWPLASNSLWPVSGDKCWFWIVYRYRVEIIDIDHWFRFGIGWILSWFSFNINTNKSQWGHTCNV